MNEERNHIIRITKEEKSFLLGILNMDRKENMEGLRIEIEGSNPRRDLNE